MNYFISKSLSWKYQRIKPSGCKDEGIRKFEFVTKTQFLYNLEYIHRIYKKFDFKKSIYFQRNNSSSKSRNGWFQHTEKNKYICLKIGFKIYWEEFINLAFLACINKKCSFSSLKRAENVFQISRIQRRVKHFTRQAQGNAKTIFYLNEGILKA